eukprot:TRINITY_DN1332_c0_g1_i6.p1 TRINITY_DN1332_c0_g1~~TRINITY_DN1332_c0_g1_i6.p1  ORF type:complete len:739 (+),score=176.85 TRINITY_DN1332_c0_g1_i6:553-2769(+)
MNTTAARPKQKLVVQPFRGNSMELSPNFHEKAWDLIRTAIEKIYSKQSHHLSFEELYRNAYYIVLHKQGPFLYSSVKQLVDLHLKEIASTVSKVPDADFLQHVVQEWHDHRASQMKIRDILMYLDRVYVAQHNALPVYELGLVFFKENVARHTVVQPRLLRGVLTLIEAERSGEISDRGVLREIVGMWLELASDHKVYEEDFEVPFLAESVLFYRREAQKLLASSGTPQYLAKVRERLKEEHERSQDIHCLPTTAGKIRSVLDKEMLEAHLATLIEMEQSGLVPMLREDKLEDLRLFYTLLQHVPQGQHTLRDKMCAFVKTSGLSIISNPEIVKEPLVFVEQLLELRAKYENIISAAFSNDKAFLNALNTTFEGILSASEKSPEYLSLFIDDILRKGTPDEDLERTLDRSMNLFRFITDKDVFEKYYKQHLAKRLLAGKSSSEESERIMISKLKTECGHQFTCKLEGMFKDIKLSADTNASFLQYVQTYQIGVNIDLNVSVLTSGFWPSSGPSPSCLFPPDVQGAMNAFHTFYVEKKHTGRRITWQPNRGTADLIAYFGKERHELGVSTFQMLILLLFNNTDSMTYTQIQEATGIPASDLRRNLQSVACGKYRVLTKEPKGKDVEDSDVFSFNGEFTCKLVRIKIGTVTAQKETEPELRETKTKLDEDRKHQIDAAIVRIMKSRKKMDHNQLVAETISQLQSRFLPNPLVIKKRIESLIEREYLERSSADMKIYNYLA